MLKTCYVERRANRRVDNLISVLLRIARDKVFERLIKVEKHSHSAKLQEINKWHVIVVDALPSENVKHILIECPALISSRNKHFISSSMKDLFDNVSARNIINFIKESHFHSTV